jgi:hypothetical protein
MKNGKMKTRKKLRKDNHIAEGEATGHFHGVVANRKGGKVSVYGQSTDRDFIVGDGGGTITHQEHKPITVDKGEWCSGIVREFDHVKEEARRVVD